MTEPTAPLAPKLELPAGPLLLDEPVPLRVTGLVPGARVTLRATCDDETGRRWQASADFVADERGVVDPAVRAPLAGSYDVVDPLGLIWSMTPDGAPTTDAMFAVTTQALTWRIAVEVGGQVVAEGSVERTTLGPGVTRTPIREAGLVATLFVPPGAGPFPAVIMVGGSEGGLRESGAALLASRGFVTLALAYFGLDPLPLDLVRIPLEYFETAIGWLQARPEVRADAIGFTGGSRGGELTLLLGTRFPQLRALAAVAPSAYVHGGLSRDGSAAGMPTPAWTWRGEAIPFVPSTRPPNAPPADANAASSEPIKLTPLFLAALEDQAAAEAARLPVERIQAPLLLLAGEDDQMWPSADFSRRVVDRLTQHDHMHPVELASFPGAGHLLSLPGVPATTTHSLHPVRSQLFAYGGRPVANRVARRDGWARLLAFFRRTLDTPTPAAPTAPEGRPVGGREETSRAG